MKQHRLLLRLVENENPELSAYHLVNRVARLTELLYENVSLAEMKRRENIARATEGHDTTTNS